MTLTASQLTEAFAAAGLRPRHALGQHFVIDPNTVRRIARLAGVGPGDRVIEVGAGPGSLTLALVETGAHVTAVELDGGLAELLAANLAGVAAGAEVEVVVADAMRLDWASLLSVHRWVLVANLPYNVGTPLLADLVQHRPEIERFLVMVQLEVARRLVAPPGDTDRGALSVRLEHHARVRIVGRVPRTVFWPTPEVESALVEIVRRTDSPIAPADEPRALELVASSFAQRRKMLRRSLAGLVPDAAFETAGVEASARPQTLTLDDWARLAAAARAASPDRDPS